MGEVSPRPTGLPWGLVTMSTRAVSGSAQGQNVTEKASP